jgi:hypothetical protein
LIKLREITGLFPVEERYNKVKKYFFEKDLFGAMGLFLCLALAIRGFTENNSVRKGVGSAIRC